MSLLAKQEMKSPSNAAYKESMKQNDVDHMQAVLQFLS